MLIGSSVQGYQCPAKSPTCSVPRSLTLPDSNATDRIGAAAFAHSVEANRLCQGQRSTMVQDVEKRPGDQPDHKTPPSPTVPFPLNYLRLVYEFMLVIVCLPFYFLYFAILPKKRWRRSWSLLEAALMPAIKRIMAAFDLCGFKVSGRDTRAEPVHWWLRLRYGVEFEWVPPLEKGLMSGVVDDSAVERTRVGMFSWKREESSTNITGQALTGLYFHGGGGFAISRLCAGVQEPVRNVLTLPGGCQRPAAYTHNSAHPKSSSSAVPKKLFQKVSPPQRLQRGHSIRRCRTHVTPRRVLAEPAFLRYV